MGWFSKIEQPLVRDVSIAVWRLFSDLDLSEAQHSHFKSMHDCFTRQLKAGARQMNPATLTSPCDAIIGASGRIAGATVIQAKGFTYTLFDLLGNEQQQLAQHYHNG